MGFGHLRVMYSGQLLVTLYCCTLTLQLQKVFNSKRAAKQKEGEEEEGEGDQTTPPTSSARVGVFPLFLQYFPSLHVAFL